jgi:hypothetical protein
MRWICIFFIASISCVGCSTIPRQVPMANEYSVSGFEANNAKNMLQSLFSSDTSILSNEAVTEILKSKVKIENNSVLAILKIPGSRSIQKYYGYNFWTSEKYLDTQEQLNKVLTNSINSKRIETVKYMPSLVIPRNLSIPLIREAGTRLQSNLILIFEEQSNIFNEYRLFKGMKIRAYASCEYILLDTRTGIILHSDIVSEKYDTEKSKDDLDTDEAFSRAETKAIELALYEIGKQVSEYIDSN